MSHRLNLLRPTLDKYKRRFHVLDLGGGVEDNQNIGQQIARSYPNAVVTVIEKDWSRDKFVPSPRTMVLRKEVTVEDLQVLSTCEHFDVVLMLNVLHWFSQRWSDALDATMKLADWVVVQVPPVEEDGEEVPGGKYIARMNFALSDGKLLGETVQFEGHRARPMWLMESTYPMGRRHLTRTHVDAVVGWADTMIVSSNFKVRAWFSKKEKSADWIPGLNLHNFCRWGGVWPEVADIMTMLDLMKITLSKGVRSDGHGDVNVHNFIMDGEGLWLIDGHEGWTSDDVVELERVKVEVAKWLA